MNERQVAQPVAPERRRRLIGIVVTVLIAALLATVWRLGGFREEQRAFAQVAPGTPIATGPFELVFTEATAQHLLPTDYRKGSWEVTVIGTGRTTGDDTISPQDSGSSSMLVARAGADQVAYPDDQKFGAGRGGFTPGLPMVRYTATFQFADGFRPGDTLRLAVIDQVFSNRALIKTEDSTDEEWHNGRDGWRLDLPLRELAPKTD